MRVTSFIVALRIGRTALPGKGFAYSVDTIVGALSRPEPGAWEFPILVEIEGDDGQHGLPFHLDIEVETPRGDVYGIDWDGIMGTRPHPDAKPVLLIGTMITVQMDSEGVYAFRFTGNGEPIGEREFPLFFGPVDESTQG